MYIKLHTKLGSYRRDLTGLRLVARWRSSGARDLLLAAAERVNLRNYIQTKRNPSIGRGFGLRTPSRIRFLRCHIRTIRLLLFGKYCAHSTIKHIGTATAEHQLEKNRPRYVPELVGKSRTGKLHVEASNFNCGCFCHPTFDIDCKN